MTLAAITRLEKLVIDNSPLLLTTVGVVGTVTTAVLTGQASIKAVELIDKSTASWEKDFVTAKDKVDITWKLFVPPAVCGGFTIAAIIGANRIGTRRAAGLAAAFTLSERAYSEYKEKVVDKLGVDKERALREELAQDRVNRTPGSSEVIITGTDSLCLDTYTGRYFRSDMTTIMRAQNEINAEVINNSYASLTDLYNLLGIEKTSASDEVGWNSDRLLDIKTSSALSPDGRPCLSISYDVDSTRDYWRNR